MRTLKTSEFKVSTTLRINGEESEVSFRKSDILLDVLRSKLGLTGAKPGCLNGDCGACTVIIDGIAQKSCLNLAIESIGKEIVTIEGLDSPIQGAFVDCFAFQCGYCTPGFIMNCHALLESKRNPSDEEITKWLESNICRCTSYLEIEKAVKSVINFSHDD
ncbi:(2Fe-2S)-binding protein [Fredinandcohnia sp. QZ13]|uniref:(2Fe-2S)-binding protein n=1 Tax=Fredinandcohnia sp. QZ13 TaxID=3073144 RepID=UPI0028533B88|nr:2Fe-2S iron-sulfur cluster-binding protein [Fredinandcohnia sp. QZ13]MDR4888016.1 (2Fe-2S)-binding protein [Fredinandcohnia sp. QZ13]